MTLSRWFSRWFGAYTLNNKMQRRAASAKAKQNRLTARTPRPHLEVLEDRTVPAHLVDSFSALSIFFTQPSEVLTLVSNGSTYTLSSTHVITGVVDPARITGIGTTTVTLQAAGLATWNTLFVDDNL
jgi:hypothetical protein